MKATKFYAHSYTLVHAGIPFKDCKLEGYTEHTDTEVYSVPAHYQNKIGVPSLRIIGCFDKPPTDGIFTEK